MGGVHQQRVIFFGFLLGLSFFLIHYCIKETGNFFETVSSSVTYPIVKVYGFVLEPFKRSMQERKTIAQLRDYVVTLEQKNEQLLAEFIALTAENLYKKHTQELRMFKERYAYSCSEHIVQIMVRHFSDQAHYYLVDGGLNKGIAVDMVAVYNNCLVGRVVEVYPWYSKVQLITDKLCKVAAVCVQTDVAGIYEGCNGQTGLLQYVDHLSLICKDDLVLSSGQGLIFPQGFGLGKIVSSYVDSLYQVVQVAPLLDFKKIQYCMIISKADVSIG